MEFFETICKRASFRGNFTTQKVPREHLRQIVQSAIDAPSGCNAQTTSFVIVDDPTLLAELGHCIKKPVCQTAPAMIVCVCEKNPVYKGTSFYIEDCSAATENMLLSITALGYASVWLDGVLRGELASQIGRLLNVPSDREVRIVLPVGVPETVPSPNKKKSFEERAFFNQFGKVQ
ncbi:MAG: nitroreductase family protein [Thermoguttaceae bacterium]